MKKLFIIILFTLLCTLSTTAQDEAQMRLSIPGDPLPRAGEIITIAYDLILNMVMGFDVSSGQMATGTLEIEAFGGGLQEIGEFNIEFEGGRYESGGPMVVNVLPRLPEEAWPYM